MMRRSVTLICVLMAVLAASGCDYFRSPEQRVAKAENLISQGEYRNALIELRNAMKDQPDLEHARLLLAEVALWLGDLAGAERELKAVSKTHQPARRADIALRVDLAAGRYAEVLASIGLPAEDQPATLWLYRGLANQGLGKFADAERDFATAFQKDSRLVAAGGGVVEMRAAQNDLNDAFERSRALTRDHPDAAIAWFVRGALLARGASLQEAQDALQHAVTLAPKQLDVMKQVSLLVTLTEVQIANRKIEEARVSAEMLARVAPGSPIASLNSARVLMASNDFANATVELRRLVNRAPQFTRARFMLGAALAAQGNLSQANQELTAVVEQVPQNMEARQLLAQVRLRLEDPDSALRVLVPALDSAGDDRAVSRLFEAARLQVGDSSRSLTLIEREYQKSPGNHGLKLQLASAYVQAQQGAKALVLLRDSPAKDRMVQRLVLAATSQAEGDAAARRKLDAMLAAQPNDPDLVLMAAQMHFAVREAPRAHQLLEAALAKNPEHDGLRLALARVQLVSGDRAAAVENLSRLRREDIHATEARLLLAQLALQRDEAKEAATLIAEAVSGAERTAETHNAAGLIYLATARFDAASDHFRAGTETDPTNAMLWLNLGRAQLALEQADAARESLNRALTLRANWLPAEGALAFLDLQSGNSAAAIKRVDALRTARPHDTDVLVLEAEVRAALQQYVEADRALGLAALRRPGPEIAVKRYNLRLAGQLPKPMEPLEEWVKVHPEDVRVRAMLAEAYVRSGARQDSVRQYEAITASQPRDVIALNNLAWLYLELGDRRAVETARRAQALAPNASAVADTLGWALVQSGALGEALPLLKKAAEAEPGNEDMQYHYAAALAKSGKSAEARARLSTLLGGTKVFASRADAEKLQESLSKASL